MNILTSTSSRGQLLFSAVLAATCHAALFGLLPAAADAVPTVRLSAYKQDLEITIVPCQPPVRERVVEPVREIREEPDRENIPVEARDGLRQVDPQHERAPERAERARERVERTPRRAVREPSKDLPIREDVERPEERFLVIREKGNDPNEALTRDVEYTLDATRLEYPRFAIEEGIEGRVLLWVHVGADGRVRDVQVAESSGHAILDTSARRQVHDKVRFRPAMRGGRPVARWVEIPVGFSLSSFGVSVGGGNGQP